MNYEQPSKKFNLVSHTSAKAGAESKAGTTSDVVTINVKRCGDDGADAGLIDLYQAQGFQYKTESQAGCTVMELSRDRAEEIRLSAIKDHYGRAKSTQRASVGPDVNLVEDRTETFQPKSPEDFLGAMGFEVEPE